VDKYVGNSDYQPSSYILKGKINTISEENLESSRRTGRKQHDNDPYQTFGSLD
jgi:hypothetical protein